MTIDNIGHNIYNDPMTIKAAIICHDDIRRNHNVMIVLADILLVIFNFCVSCGSVRVSSYQIKPFVRIVPPLKSG